jgi:hypothetical protein
MVPALKLDLRPSRLSTIRKNNYITYIGSIEVVKHYKIKH